MVKRFDGHQNPCASRKPSVGVLVWRGQA